MNIPAFRCSTLAEILEQAPASLPVRFSCAAPDRFTAGVLTSQLVRLGYTCVVDADTNSIEARGPQPSKGGDYVTVTNNELTQRGGQGSESTGCAGPRCVK